MRNKLLIATVVTALLAGAGLASAQQNQPGSPSGGPNASPPASQAQSTPQAQATPRAQPTQQQRNRVGQSSRPNAQARQNQPRGRMEQRRGIAQNQQRTERRRNMAQAQQRQNTVQGRPENRQRMTQGRGNNRLTSQQRNRIRQAVLGQRGAPRVTRRDLGGINLRVGATIPRNRLRFRPLPLPASIVSIAPQWSGFLYFLVGGEVVVLDPVTYQVVAILPA
jgi:hypothetical protein